MARTFAMLITPPSTAHHVILLPSRLAPTPAPATSLSIPRHPIPPRGVSILRRAEVYRVYRVLDASRSNHHRGCSLTGCHRRCWTSPLRQSDRVRGVGLCRALAFPVSRPSHATLLPSIAGV